MTKGKKTAWHATGKPLTRQLPQRTFSQVGWSLTGGRCVRRRAWVSDLNPFELETAGRSLLIESDSDGDWIRDGRSDIFIALTCFQRIRWAGILGPMKCVSMWAIGVGLSVVGFIAGCLFQDARGGYHFKIIEENAFQSSVDTVRWIHATEAIGMPVLDGGTTMIVCGDRTVYKAKREFQEDSPFAKNVKVNGNVIEWDDGVSHFQLTIVDAKNGKKPGSAQ
jgi:hypothetical protein